jgi:uncharacterized membrane protein YuzA (DUF378 family)
MFIVNVIALVLVVAGAINWGCVGIFNYNVINAIFGGEPMGMYTVGARALFSIVGLAGIWALSFFGRTKALCCCCKDGSCCCGKCKRPRD